MLDKIIADVEKALDAEAYLSALSLMMTIPDVCAKAEYGDDLKNKERYVKWFEEYIGKYNKAPVKNGETGMPYLSGEIAYQLRCSILHEGNPDIDKSKIKDEANQIDSFALIVETKKPFDIYVDSSSVASEMDGIVTCRSYEINIRRLWVQIKSVASRYYAEHKEKFDFLNFKVVDMDQRTALMERLNKKTKQ